jgi:SAM-dependent methyltransferase
MAQTTEQIQADFDRIALFEDESWDHNSHYNRFLLKQLPEHFGKALEIGCGTGGFARLLAKRSEKVLGVDLSPKMLEIARERSREYRNIDFQELDVLSWGMPVERFDCIASIATLHHLPFEEMLVKLKKALKPGGTLLVLDLYEGEKGVANLLSELLAVALHNSLNLAKTGKLRKSPEARAAWDEHGRTDKYLTVSQVRRSCESLLPGAKVTKHLLWRYSIVWKKEL